MGLNQGHLEMHMAVLECHSDWGRNWVYCSEMMDAKHSTCFRTTCFGVVSHSWEFPRPEGQLCPCLGDGVQLIIWIIKTSRPDIPQVNKLAVSGSDLHVFEIIQFFFLLSSYANFNSSCTAGVKRPSPPYSERTNQSLCVLVPGYLFFPPCLFVGTASLVFPTNGRA